MGLEKNYVEECTDFSVADKAARCIKLTKRLMWMVSIPQEPLSGVWVTVHLEAATDILFR